MNRFTVYVSNIGNVYNGSNKFDAMKAFNKYVGQSKRGYGRASGESVTLLDGDTLLQEHIGVNQMCDDPDF